MMVHGKIKKRERTLSFAQKLEVLYKQFRHEMNLFLIV